MDKEIRTTLNLTQMELSQLTIGHKPAADCITLIHYRHYMMVLVIFLKIFFFSSQLTVQIRISVLRSPFNVKFTKSLYYVPGVIVFEFYKNQTSDDVFMTKVTLTLTGLQGCLISQSATCYI